MTDYEKIQDDYEKWLRDFYKNIPAFITRPDFKKAAIQYASCRRELDQEFMKEFSALKHFDLQMPTNS